jgi:hypothetical protein
MTDLLLTTAGVVPVMVVAGRRVVDFSGFAPVTGTHVVASLMEYDDEVLVCTNVDTSLVSPQIFHGCARDALTNILTGVVTEE